MSAAPKSDGLLILSQDYELFFHKSGTVERCLLEPCEAWRQFCRRTGVRITFYVDAGMLVRMRAYADSVPSLSRDLDRIRGDIETLARDGHEIGLHVHPHWEDTHWRSGEWRFAHTRYAPERFSTRELRTVFRTYAEALADITGAMPTSYRAGGFCIEPFERVGEALRSVGIFTDSSVVPGASLGDDEKGFDFRAAPRDPFWFFDDNPLFPVSSGRFLEVPISTTRIPFLYYWQRLATRLRGRQPDRVFGDGMSKAIGNLSALRRLAGLERITELSVDVPKVEHLASTRAAAGFCHVMGHPKLLSPDSLDRLETFIAARGIGRFETVSSVAGSIRRGALSASA